MRTVGLLALGLANAANAATPESRAAALLAKMTLEDKLGMVHGYSNSPTPGPGYVGYVVPNTALGIPAIKLEDGPQGVGDGQRDVTCFPSGLTITASWDEQGAYTWGQTMAIEQRGKGSNVLLGPGVNLARVPVDGRTYEFMGEDPHLIYKLAYAETKGIQSEGVIGCIKHWVNNNQEGPGINGRMFISEQVGERAAYELYYPGFQGSIDAGVGSAMCSYNKINGTYACENPETLQILKTTLGFKGWMMSDWGATHSTVAAANAGLDQQMPDDSFFGAKLAAAVQAGNVTVDRINDMVTRMLVPMFAVGLFDNPPSMYGSLSDNVTSPEHAQIARELAENSTVLLKNEGLLPINPKMIGTTGNIAILGDATIVHGIGSGAVIPPYIVSPTTGVLNRVKSLGIKVVNRTVFDMDSTGKAPNITPQIIQESVALAKAASLVILNVAVNSGEGEDREDLGLGAMQDKLVQAVAAVNENVVVVVRCPGAVRMPWADDVKSILVQFMPGQESGNALASVLFGDVNPSGKLPITFPHNMEETWLRTVDQYPGVQTNGLWSADYSEGLLVGYRWYQAKGIQPLFPFGHGLSYSTFEYSNLSVTSGPDGSATVSFTLANTLGSSAGAEVAQVYVTYPAAAQEPPVQLRGFQKVHLALGESTTVSIDLVAQGFAIWDVTQGAWAAVAGTFTIQVGTSSANLSLSTTIQRSN